MAKNTSNPLTYFVSIDISKKKMLGNVRLWENLKIAYDQNLIWIKDLTEEQTRSVEIMSIPSFQTFYQKENKLFKAGSLLPSGNTPSLLWTSIDRALPVNFPSYNDNYFGLGEQSLDIKLIPSYEEKEAYAFKVTVEELEKYIEKAPKIRLKNLKWTLISSSEVMLFGTPLLPIKGDVFWKQGRQLLPVGYKLNYPILSDYICKKNQISTGNWLCWISPDWCIKIETGLLESLSISSFRSTISDINPKENEPR